MLKIIGLDEYILTTLMRDMVGHDRNPSGYLVYLHLACECELMSSTSVRASHRQIAENTGLSKSAA